MNSLKKLWPFFKEHKKNLILMFICGGLMSLCQALISPIIAYLFDRVFSQSTFSSKLDFVDHFFASTFGNSPETLVWAIPVACFCLYFVNGISRYLHMFSMRYTGDKVSARIRSRLLNKYMNLNLTFHNNYDAGSGGLLSRTMSDVFIIQNSTGIIADFIREPLLAILLMSYMVYVDWQLTISILLIAPILIFILQRLARSLRKYGHLHQEAMESLTSTLKESLDGVKVIQSFNLENKISQDFDKKNSLYLKTRKKIVAREEVSGPISELLGAAVFGGMAYYFGAKVLNNTSSPGVFLSFVTAMGFMQKPIKKIQDAFIRLQQTIVSTDRIMKILDDDQSVVETEKPLPFPKEWQKIQFQNLSFSYGDEKILDQFNLEVKKGEVIAIIGSSGSGKSTLINLLKRFFDPSEGQILIGNTDTKNMSLKDLRANMALVTQDVFLFNDSIEKNIQFGDLNKNQDVTSSAQSANAMGFIEKFPQGIQSPVGERGGLLSGGEKQRISIARAIYKDAPILILDEATSALDSVSELEVQKGLESLMVGRTVFVIAHRLSTIQGADRILVLDKGKIVEQGNHQELLDLKGHYFNFHQLQS